MNSTRFCEMSAWRAEKKSFAIQCPCECKIMFGHHCRICRSHTCYHCWIFTENPWISGIRERVLQIRLCLSCTNMSFSISSLQWKLWTVRCFSPKTTLSNTFLLQLKFIRHPFLDMVHGNYKNKWRIGSWGWLCLRGRPPIYMQNVPSSILVILPGYLSYP